MTRYFFLILLLTTAAGARAQLRLQVVDSASAAPLPYATVQCREVRWVRFADSLGRLSIPDSLLGKTVLVSFTGHYPKELLFRGGGEVPLAPLPPLDTVQVRGCAATEPLTFGTAAPGELERKIRFRESILSDHVDQRWRGPLDGGLLAHWIANPSGKAGWLHSLTFGAHPFWHHKRYQGYPNTPVRLRFFDRGADGMPGEELTRADVVVSAGRFGPIVVLLDDKHVRLPAEGLFVAFELFDAGSAWWWEVPFDKEPDPTAIRRIYGFSFVAHQGPMYFRNPWVDWTKRDSIGALELALRLEARVCR